MAQDDKDKLRFGISIEDEDPSKGSSDSIPSEAQNANSGGEPTVHFEVEDGGPELDRPHMEEPMDSIGSEGYGPDQRQMSPTYADAQRPGSYQGGQGYNGGQSPYSGQSPKQVNRQRGGSSFPTDNIGGNRGGLENGNNRSLDNGGNNAPLDKGGATGEPAPRKNEQAPDMGKDYGSSNPPAGPANQPAQNGAQGGGAGGQNPPTPGGVPPVPAEKGQGDINNHPSDVDNEMPKKDGVGDQADAQKKGLEKDPEGKKDGLEKEGEGEGKKPGEEGEGKKGEEKPENPEAKGGKNAPMNEEKAGKPEPKKPVGNGYGALRDQKPVAGQNQENADITRHARQNANKNGTGTGQGKGEGKKKGKASTGSINTPIKPSFGQRAKTFLKNRIIGGKNQGGERESEYRASIAGTGFASKWGEIAKGWLLSHPLVLCALIVAGIVFLIILSGLGGTNSNWSTISTSGGHCAYNLKGVVSSGEINLDGIQVEIVNCDAKKDNYRVIETVDFEEYVIGVAWAETQYHAEAPAYFQAQIVAARGFALRRNSSMCPSNPDNCFYGYNPNTGKIRLRNCSNDQNYCNIDKPCYRKERSGQKALTGLEAEQEGPTRVWYPEPSEEKKNEMRQAAEVVKGKVLLDTSGNVVYTNYVNTDQQHWYQLARQGMDYEEILKTHYSGQNASGMTSAVCTTAGNIDYGDYVLSSDGHQILHEPLDQFLQKQGTSLEAFNSLIESNVQKAGYGTRAGVVAAAVTLIGELGNKYGVKVPYYWGGGHGDGVAIGALAKWGSNTCHTTANGQSYDYCGLDCSGFVPWAIKNGGFNMKQNLASNFQNISGAQRVSLSSSQAVLQPGDLLECSHHVVLVIGIEESSGNYICAEAAGNAKGVLFTRRPFGGGGEYWGVKMDEYYANNVRSQ